MSECSFFDNGICRAASTKAGLDIPTYERSCIACLEGKPVIDGLITIELHKQGLNHKVVVASTGVGSLLASWIDWFPIPKKKGCTKCSELKNRMNNWGPDKCREKQIYIIKKLRIGWIRRFGTVPFPEKLARSLVMKAITTIEAKS